jgi:hypothetical protein
MFLLSCYNFDKSDQSKRRGDLALENTMNTATIIPVSPTDLEKMIRRVVREELSRTPQPSILDDWSQEGPDDPAGDAALLREAEQILAEAESKPEMWLNLADFEKELDRAEAAGELPG